jgi:large subunit ribosomal protein L25
VNVPVHFKGQDVSPGIKQGGTLNIVSHSVALTCSANLIPDDVTVDVSTMQVGQSVHLSNIALPEGVKSASSDDVTLCAITAQAKEEEAPADAAAEVPATNQKAPAGKAAAPAQGGAAPAAAAAAPAKKK